MSKLVVNNIRHVGGIILGKEKSGGIICLSKESVINRNIAVYGATGTRKKRGYIKPMILERIHAKETVIITDTSLSEYTDIINIAKREGHRIQVLSKETLYASEIKYLLGEERLTERAEMMAHTVADILIKSKIKSISPDAFTETMETSLLKSLILYVGYSRRYNGGRTMCDLADLLKKTPSRRLDDIFMRWDTEEALKYAYMVFAQAGDKKTEIKVRLSVMLSEFKTPGEIPDEMKIFGTDTLKLSEDVPQAVFIISEEDEYSGRAGALFVSLVLSNLKASQNKMSANRKNAFLILNRIAQLGSVPELHKILSCSKDFSLSVSIVLRSITELRLNYKDTWKDILKCCDIQLFLGTRDWATAKYISEKTMQLSKDRTGYSPEQIISMDHGELLILTNISPALRANKYNYIDNTTHEKVKNRRN